MAVTYTWRIVSLRTHTEGSNVDSVCEVDYEKTGTDDNGTTGSYMGSCALSSADTSSYTAFADLTENQVIAWVQAATDDTEINQYIAADLMAQTNPLVDQGLPWAG